MSVLIRRRPITSDNPGLPRRLRGALGVVSGLEEPAAFRAGVPRHRPVRFGGLPFRLGPVRVPPVRCPLRLVPRPPSALARRFPSPRRWYLQPAQPPPVSSLTRTPASPPGVVDQARPGAARLPKHPRELPTRHQSRLDAATAAAVGAPPVRRLRAGKPLVGGVGVAGPAGVTIAPAPPVRRRRVGRASPPAGAPLRVQDEDPSSARRRRRLLPPPPHAQTGGGQRRTSDLDEAASREEPKAKWSRHVRRSFAGEPAVPASASARHRRPLPIGCTPAALPGSHPGHRSGVFRDTSRLAGGAPRLSPAPRRQSDQGSCILGRRPHGRTPPSGSRPRTQPWKGFVGSTRAFNAWC